MRLQEIFGERLKKDEPLKKHTTFKIGGPADWYLEARSADEAGQAIRAAKEDGLPIFLLGGGSNILVADAGIRGLTMVYAARAMKFDGDRLTAETGASTTLVSRMSAERGLAGFEWAVGVPGALGGAIRGNAGGYGREIKDSLVSVSAVDLETGESRTFASAECEFAYRESRFKREPWLLTEAVFEFAPGDKEGLLRRQKEIIASRLDHLPMEYGNAGSVFKNHYFGDPSELPPKLPPMLKPEFLEWKKIPAAWLIERVEIKGKRIGDAMISEKHANFIVNLGQAKADEVVRLISYAKMKVRDELGIQLQEEIQYVGF